MMEEQKEVNCMSGEGGDAMVIFDCGFENDQYTYIIVEDACGKLRRHFLRSAGK